MYHYKDSKFHRLIADWLMQGGDTTSDTGTGGLSIYGHRFDDEGIWYPHASKGVLTTAGTGPNTNGSQFLLCLCATPNFNERHTVFGRVISGWEIIEKAEKVEVDEDDVPSKPVKIVDCGELTGDWKLKEDAAEFLANYV